MCIYLLIFAVSKNINLLFIFVKCYKLSRGEIRLLWITILKSTKWNWQILELMVFSIVGSYKTDNYLFWVTVLNKYKWYYNQYNSCVGNYQWF